MRGLKLEKVRHKLQELPGKHWGKEKLAFSQISQNQWILDKLSYGQVLASGVNGLPGQALSAAELQVEDTNTREERKSSTKGEKKKGNKNKKKKKKKRRKKKSNIWGKQPKVKCKQRWGMQTALFWRCQVMPLRHSAAPRRRHNALAKGELETKEKKNKGRLQI